MNENGHIPCKKGKQARQAVFLVKLIEENLNISGACRALPIARQTFYNWLKSSGFNEKYVELVETWGDLVEQALFENAVFRKDVTAQIFLCKTKLKKRGYY